MTQLEDNVGASTGWSLSDEEVACQYSEHVLRFHFAGFNQKPIR